MIEKLKIKHMSLATTALLLCGCSSTYTAKPYDKNHSRAYNLAYGAGIDNGLNDTKVPKDSTKNMFDSTLWGAAYGYSGYADPLSGLSNWSNAGLNVLAWAISPTKNSAKNSYFAYMPATLAKNPEDAKVKMRDIYRKAIPEAMQALGGEAVLALVTEKDHIDAFHVINKKWGCTKEVDNCAIIVRTLKPNTGNAPTWLGGKPSYVFNEFGSYHNKVAIFVDKGLKIPENEIYAAVSKALPKWTYLYLAPNKVKLANGKKIPYNYLLDDGKPLFFIYPNA